MPPSTPTSSLLSQALSPVLTCAGLAGALYTQGAVYVLYGMITNPVLMLMLSISSGHNRIGPRNRKPTQPDFIGQKSDLLDLFILLNIHSLWAV